MKRQFTAATIGLTLSFASGALTVADFAHRARIEAGTGLHVLELNEAAQRAALTHDLSDLRIFNAAGEALPLASLPMPSPAGSAAVSVPMTVLPADDKARDARVADFALRISKDGGAAVIEMTPTTASPATDEAGAYLLDLRSLRGKSGTLTLQFVEDAPEHAGRVDLTGSDDLVSWRNIGGGALARSRRFSEVFERNEFGVGRLPSFVRVTWPSGPIPRLAGAAFAEQAAAAALPRAALAVSREDDRTLHIDIPIGLAAESLHLRMPDNSSAQFAVEFESELDERAGRTGVRSARRDRTRTPPSVSAKFFRIERDGVWIDSPPLRTPPRVTGARLVAMEGFKFGRELPSAEVEYRPKRIAFVARPPTPLTLAIGHRQAQPGPLMATRGVLADDDPAGTRLPLARLAADGSALSDDRTGRIAQHAVWSRYALWAALLAAVIFLSYMAWRLSSQLRASAPSADGEQQ